MLPIVFKADFIRRNDALSRRVNPYPQRHVPVHDFSLANLSIWHHKKSFKKIVNIEKSPKCLIFTSDEEHTIHDVYNYVLYQQL